MDVIMHRLQNNVMLVLNFTNEEINLLLIYFNLL